MAATAVGVELVQQTGKRLLSDASAEHGNRRQPVDYQFLGIRSVRSRRFGTRLLFQLDSRISNVNCSPLDKSGGSGLRLTSSEFPGVDGEVPLDSHVVHFRHTDAGFERGV